MLQPTPETMNAWADHTTIPTMETGRKAWTDTFAIHVDHGYRSWCYCHYHLQDLNTKAALWLPGCILWPLLYPGCWNWPCHCHAKCWSFLIWNLHWHWRNIKYMSSSRILLKYLCLLKPTAPDSRTSFSEVRLIFHLPERMSTWSFTILPSGRQVISPNMDFHREWWVQMLVTAQAPNIYHGHLRRFVQALRYVSCHCRATRTQFHSTGTTHDLHQGFC